MNSLGNYTHCPWCGLEHEELEGWRGEGYEIALQNFDRDGTVETLDALHDGYLCDECAQIAAAGRELLAACKALLAGIEAIEAGEQDWFHYHATMHDARLAIANATGVVKSLQ